MIKSLVNAVNALIIFLTMIFLAFELLLFVIVGAIFVIVVDICLVVVAGVAGTLIWCVAKLFDMDNKIQPLQQFLFED